jgi:hypothetical protein
MSGLGTDMVAVACILGGATVSGAVTARALDAGGDQVGLQPGCAVEALHVGPRMVVVTGGSERVVVAPSPRVRWHGDAVGEDQEACAIVVDPRVKIRVQEANERTQGAQERMQRAQERAQERMQRARERIERARERMDGVEGVEMDRMRAELEAQLSELQGAEAGLQGLDLTLDGLHLNLEGLGESLGEQISTEVEGRLEMEMRELEKRLERIRMDGGR